MSRTSSPNGEQSVVAVLHPVGRAWRCVVVRREGSSMSLVEAREFEPLAANRIDGWLDGHAPGRTIVVLPAGSVVCRTCQLPNAPAEQLMPALRLQAETHQLGGIPPHRSAMAVLPSAPGETSRSGLMLGWPLAADTPDVPTRRPVTFCPDVAALAALLGEHRPGDPLIWLSRDDASLAMGIPHAHGAVFRAVREDTDSTEAWVSGVSRAVVETSVSVGHTGHYIDGVVAQLRQRVSDASGGALLIIPGELLHALVSRVSGTGSDEAWWTTFGIAAGAAIADAGELADVTRMLAEPPADAPNLAERAVRALSSRRFATAAVVAALAVIVFGPMAFAWTRLRVLQTRVPDIEAYDARLKDLQKRVDFYRAVHDEAWSMTKLLADVGNNTPDDIDIQKIDINFGEAVVIVGKASPRSGGPDAATLVLTMAKNLNESGVFARCDHRLEAQNAVGAREFRMTAEVVRPHKIVAYTPERDFGIEDLRRRLYGPNPYETPSEDVVANAGDDPPPADPEAAAPPPDALADAGSRAPALPPLDPEGNDVEPIDPESNDSEDPPSRRTPAVRSPNGGPRGGIDRPDRPAGTGGGNDGVGSARDRIGGPRASEVPPPLSEAEIKAMSKAEAYAALEKVSKARKNPPDTETGDRLKTEFDLLLKQMREANK